jgi:phenylpropionate dioxygenase-like ring-hydroxylating dioxygenase large terminal subunit
MEVVVDVARRPRVGGRNEDSRSPGDGLEDEGWQPVQAFNIDLKARYQILHENLLDLSHLTFLHESIIGRDEIATADV